MTKDLSETAEPQASAADQSDWAASRHSQIASLRTSIADLLALADELALPFVAIHLDHALALCSEEIAGLGHEQ